LTGNRVKNRKDRTDTQWMDIMWQWTRQTCQKYEARSCNCCCCCAKAI